MLLHALPPGRDLWWDSTSLCNAPKR
jgi:hypothetical protein